MLKKISQESSMVSPRRLKTRLKAPGIRSTRSKLTTKPTRRRPNKTGRPRKRQRRKQRNPASKESLRTSRKSQRTSRKSQRTTRRLAADS
jgi:hypothetical protein